MYSSIGKKEEWMRTKFLKLNNKVYGAINKLTPKHLAPLITVAVVLLFGSQVTRQKHLKLSFMFPNNTLIGIYLTTVVTYL